LAFFEFQSTLIERIPGALLNDSSTVDVQGGQCRPVMRYVAEVALAASVLAGSAAPANATCDNTIVLARKIFVMGNPLFGESNKQLRLEVPWLPNRYVPIRRTHAGKRRTAFCFERRQSAPKTV
jgi:hypothetical protein